MIIGFVFFFRLFVGHLRNIATDIDFSEMRHHLSLFTNTFESLYLRAFIIAKYFIQLVLSIHFFIVRYIGNRNTAFEECIIKHKNAFMRFCFYYYYFIKSDLKKKMDNGNV